MNNYNELYEFNCFNYVLLDSLQSCRSWTRQQGKHLPEWAGAFLIWCFKRFAAGKNLGGDGIHFRRAFQSPKGGAPLCGTELKKKDMTQVVSLFLVGLKILDLSDANRSDSIFDRIRHENAFAFRPSFSHCPAKENDGKILRRHQAESLRVLNKFATFRKD